MGGGGRGAQLKGGPLGGWSSLSSVLTSLPLPWAFLPQCLEIRRWVLLCSEYRLLILLSNPHPRPEVPFEKTQRSLCYLNPWGLVTMQRRNRISCSVLWFLRGRACTHKHAHNRTVSTTKGFTAPRPTSPSCPQAPERPGSLPTTHPFQTVSPLILAPLLWAFCHGEGSLGFTNKKQIRQERFRVFPRLWRNIVHHQIPSLLPLSRLT